MTDRHAGLSSLLGLRLRTTLCTRFRVRADDGQSNTDSGYLGLVLASTYTCMATDTANLRPRTQRSVYRMNAKTTAAIVLSYAVISW